MAVAVAGLSDGNIIIEDPQCVPNHTRIFDDMKALGAVLMFS